MSFFTLFILGLLASLCLFVISCTEVENPSEALLTDDEALEIVEASLQAGAEGMASEMEDIEMVVSEEIPLESLEGVDPDSGSLEFDLASLCGATFDTSVTISRTLSRISGSFNSAWTYGLNCSTVTFAGLNFYIPLSIDVNRQSQGTIETRRLTSVDSIQASWNLSNLISGDYTLAGISTRNCEQVLTFQTAKSLETTTVLTVDSVAFDRLTYQIVSGSATMTLNSVSSEGGTYSTTVKVTFLGDAKAEIDLNGTIYEIEW